MREVTKKEFERRTAGAAVEMERDTEFWYDVYVDTSTGYEIGWISYNSNNNPEYMLGD